MKRFQMNFSTQDEHEKCCELLRDLGFQVSKPHISITSQLFNGLVQTPMNGCNNIKTQFERANLTMLHPSILTPQEFSFSQGALNGHAFVEDTSRTDILNEPGNLHGHDITTSPLDENNMKFNKKKVIPGENTESHSSFREHNPYSVFEAEDNTLRHVYKNRNHSYRHDHFMTPNVCGLVPSELKPSLSERTYYTSAQNETLGREHGLTHDNHEIAMTKIPMVLSNDSGNGRFCIKRENKDLLQNVANTFGSGSASTMSKFTPQLIKCDPSSLALTKGLESRREASEIKDAVKQIDGNSELIPSRAQSRTHQPIRDYWHLNDRQLKKVIRKKLQDEDFVKLVRRLDKIVTP